ncbi:MAG TPA: GxxExxY protein [Phycisphaerales bacterium]|nr:GxxExxY protein [Phycisphaerales bacterium]
MSFLHHRDTEAQRKASRLAGMGLVNPEHERDPLTQRIIGAAIEVHKSLGPGLLEAVYEQCLAIELVHRGLNVLRQVNVPIVYREVTIDAAYRADMVVDDLVVLELKAVEVVLPVHEAQLLSYMRLLNKRVGLLLNFHVPVMTKGIYRRVL